MSDQTSEQMNTSSINDRQRIFEKIFREHLKIETYSKSIDSLFTPRQKRKIDYKPYYQRNYVWDNNKATYFIESILLGTEIPPLIFFNNNTNIEVIDGRQRYETILRFMENKFSLSAKGLNTLKQLKKLTYEDLGNLERGILESFLDSKLRIIEFQLVNEPPLDKHLEDRVKKEIFSRYNSGITPLRKAEIDNAIYDEDSLTNAFKAYLGENPDIKQKVYRNFCLIREENPPIETIMSFIRRSMVLPMFPINYFARGTDRTDIFSKLYDVISDKSVDNENEIISKFVEKILIISDINEIAEKEGLKINRLASECFLWALGILDQEEYSLEVDDSLKRRIAEYIDHNENSYSSEDYAFQIAVMERYSCTARFLNELTGVDCSVYVNADEEHRERIKELKKPDDAHTRLSELESLRLNKPEPARNSIEDIIRSMQRRRFLVRPTYQRNEVINPSKCSSIIESILLGITLPAIFVYKRADGVNEVIDGQQRILTLLGFLGEEYNNEKGSLMRSKNHKFSLRKLRILSELNGKKFDDLPEEYQEKIFDFQLYIVEIDQKQNPLFNPIDLFIRLNDKPYPIREHSFEMWNSWGDVDVIDSVKQLTKDHRDWFYVKQLRSDKDRDRMENEELLLTFAYLNFATKVGIKGKLIEVYEKSNRINLRFSKKPAISNLLVSVTEEVGETKNAILESVKNTKSLIRKLRYILLDCDKSKEELIPYLKGELDKLFQAGKVSRYFRRTRQDYYAVWLLLSNLNMEMVRHHRLEMKTEIKDIFKSIKAHNEDEIEEGKRADLFNKSLNEFLSKYKQDTRSLKLNEDQISEKIKEQNNRCGISGTPIFLGDDLEVDHQLSLAHGGGDVVENLQIADRDANRSKGAG
jgi:uncharacterized protein with ParB-like and HNH nuclease domain